jgi:membrane protein implicated in regulation of membrane protease activity
MKTRIPVSVFIVTALLLLYTILISLNAPLQITGFLFFISSFLLTWMAVSILKSMDHNKKDLAEGEEWGYADKKKEELDIF